MTRDKSNAVVVIGAGHNGLVCAFYLARAGLKVTVLERRGVVGGAAVTEEFHPGFRNSVASYTASLLQPKIITDMSLHEHGLMIVERKVQNFLPTLNGQYLMVGEGRTRNEVAKFSARDAERLDEYNSRLGRVANFVRGLMLELPPNIGDVANPKSRELDPEPRQPGGSRVGWIAALPEIMRSAKIARAAARLDTTAKRDLLALFGRSAGDFLDDWFESDPIKAVFGFDGIVGNYASPYAPGSGYVLLHHLLGEVNGKPGQWGHAIGGMGAITGAMANACRAEGVEIRVNTSVKEITRAGGVGVVCANGEVIHARAVVSNLNPKLTFGRLIDPGLLPADFRERIDRYRMGSGTFRMNLALSELPRFSCLPQAGDHLTAGIILAPSLAYMENAYTEARQFGWSKNPVVEMLIPSTLDDSLAPKGAHVASLFCQHAAPTLPDGSSWDDHRDEVADLMVATVEKFVPGFSRSVIGRQALTPLDLERVFGLTAGDIMHGRLQLDQLFSARPVLGYGNYRTPIAGLYMCGSGTHPGGGVTGAPGHNAAREIIRDLRRKWRH